MGVTINKFVEESKDMYMCCPVCEVKLKQGDEIIRKIQGAGTMHEDDRREGGRIEGVQDEEEKEEDEEELGRVRKKRMMAKGKMVERDWVIR